MEWRHAWLICLMLCGFTVHAQKDRQVLLKQACSQFDSALVVKDTAELRILLSEHFRMKHSNGLEETRKELLQHLNEGFLKYNEIIQEGEAVIEFDEELGFVTRNLKVSGILNGSSFSVKLKATELWSWNYNSYQWQLKARQSTKTN